MEAKLAKVLNEIAEFRKKLDNLTREAEENKRKLDELKRLADTGRYNDEMLKELQRDIKEIKTTINNDSINIKEIMNGMGIIYRSVDEIEDNVVPERETR